MILQNEEWKKINGYDYFVSDMGRIKNAKGKLKTPQLNKGKKKYYHRIALWNGGVATRFYVHRLVAQYFVDGYDPKKEVNHIDGNPINNIKENLEWVNHSENVSHWHRELKNK